MASIVASKLDRVLLFHVGFFGFFFHSVFQRCPVGFHHQVPIIISCVFTSALTFFGYALLDARWSNYRI